MPWMSAWLCLEEIVKEVLVAILVTRLGNILLGHQVVVGMVPLPCLLLALFGDPSFFLLLKDYQLLARKASLRYSTKEGKKGQR